MMSKFITNIFQLFLNVGSPSGLPFFDYLRSVFLIQKHMLIIDNIGVVLCVKVLLWSKCNMLKKEHAKAYAY